MRHYLWHDANGRLTGYHFDPQNGWVGCDLTDAGSSDPMIVLQRSEFIGNEMGNTDCIPYDCACGTVNPDCDHPHQRLMDSYHDGAGGLATRRDATMNADAANVVNLSILDKTAGSTVVFKVIDGSAGDGETVTVKNFYGDMLASETTLTFTGGETNTVNLTAPAAPGLVERIMLDGLKIKAQSLGLRGT